MKPIWRKLIAVQQMVGGVCGAATVAYQLILQHHDPTDIGLAAWLIAAYLLALFAGITLWLGTQVGRWTSIVAQLIQLPRIFSPNLGFMVSYGLDLSLLLVSSPVSTRPGIDIDIHVFAYPFLVLHGSGPTIGFGFSLVSLLALRLLLRPAVPIGPHVSNPPVPAVKSDHPDWVPSFGFILLGVLVLVVVAVCVGVPLLSR